MSPSTRNLLFSLSVCPALILASPFPQVETSPKQAADCPGHKPCAQPPRRHRPELGTTVKETSETYLSCQCETSAHEPRDQCERQANQWLHQHGVPKELQCQCSTFIRAQISKTTVTKSKVIQPRGGDSEESSEETSADVDEGQAEEEYEEEGEYTEEDGSDGDDNAADGEYEEESDYDEDGDVWEEDAEYDEEGQDEVEVAKEAEEDATGDVEDSGEYSEEAQSDEEGESTDADGPGSANDKQAPRFDCHREPEECPGRNSTQEFDLDCLLELIECPYDKEHKGNGKPGRPGRPGASSKGKSRGGKEAEGRPPRCPPQKKGPTKNETEEFDLESLLESIECPCDREQKDGKPPGGRKGTKSNGREPKCPPRDQRPTKNSTEEIDLDCLLESLACPHDRECQGGKGRGGRNSTKPEGRKPHSCPEEDENGHLPSHPKPRRPSSNQKPQKPHKKNEEHDSHPSSRPCEPSFWRQLLGLLSSDFDKCPGQQSAEPHAPRKATLAKRNEATAADTFTIARPHIIGPRGADPDSFSLFCVCKQGEGFQEALRKRDPQPQCPPSSSGLWISNLERAQCECFGLGQGGIKLPQLGHSGHEDGHEDEHPEEQGEGSKGSQQSQQ